MEEVITGDRSPTQRVVQKFTMVNNKTAAALGK